MDLKTNGGKLDDRFVFRVGLVRDVEGFQIAEGKTHIDDTGTVALVGDIVRFEDGAYQYVEVPIISVDNDGDGFTIPGSYSGLVAGDEFYILRHVTQRTDDSGAQTVVVAPSPIAFVLNGVDTEVSEDTAVPGNSRPLPVKNLNSYLSSVRLDYAITNVTTGAWVELVADIGAVPVNGITLFDGGGYAMELGVGAAAAEVRTLLIPPGGFNGLIPFFIPANARLSIRAIGAATVDAGEIDLNLMR